MYIQRNLEKHLKNVLKTGKIIILYGARQVGKTTLLQHLFPSNPPQTLFLACDEVRIQEALIPDRLALERLFGKARLVILDEAHLVPNIGRVLKIAADHLPHVRIIATGSAAFELKNTVSEPLTGRHIALSLPPLLFRELVRELPTTDYTARFDDLLRYGSYPEVAITLGHDDKIRHLRTLTDTYLYKDILAFDRVKSSAQLRHLLSALALQLGNEVSYNELGQQIGMSYKTVERYIDLLEKSFVLFRLRAWSKNPRSELSRKVKVYFFDCGVRNAIINNFNTLSLRTDGGALYENAMIADRMKRERNEAQPATLYFWRSYSQQEVDLIAEKNGRLEAFEFKTRGRRSMQPPSGFTTLYPTASYTVIAADDPIARDQFLAVHH